MSINDSPKVDRKSLFSIQVDDFVIQRIFKSLEDEVRRLSDEVEKLQNLVNEKASKEEFDDVYATVSEVKEKSFAFTSKFENEMASFSNTFDTGLSQMKSYVKDQVTEAIFSVNNVVRAQNSLIEEKVFQFSKPSNEVTQVVADVDRMKRDNESFRTNIDTIKDFFSTFLGSTNNKKTLPEIISMSLQPERDTIKEIEKAQERADSRIKGIEEKMYIIVGTKEVWFPLYGKAQKHMFHEKPKIPKLQSVKCYTDYFSYIMNLAPTLQKILMSFYHQIVGLSNSVYDKEEKEGLAIDLEEKISQINEVVADVRDLKENEKRISDIECTVKEIQGAQPMLSTIMDQVKNLKENVMTKTETNDSIQNVKSDLIQQIQLLKMERSFAREHAKVKPNITHNMSYDRPFFQNDQNDINDQANKYSQIQPLNQMNQMNNNQFGQQTTQISQNNPNKLNLDAASSRSIHSNYSNRSSEQNPQSELSADMAADPHSSAIDDDSQELFFSSNASPTISPSNSQVSSLFAPQGVKKKDQHPAITAVLPRGRASFKMIYGEGSGRPSSSRINVRRRDDLEEGGRSPKKSQRVIQVQIPTESLPNPEPTNLFY